MAWCATGVEPWATWLGGSRRARDGEVPEVTDQRVSAGSLWAVVPKTPSSPAGRRPLPTAAWGRARIEGGGWDALRDLRRLAKADEGRWRSRRGANRSTEQRACWLGCTGGAGPELTAHWSRCIEEAWPARARGRASEVGLACPLAGPATSAAGARPSSTTVQPSGPPRSGWGSREGKRDEATRAAGSGRGKPGRGVEARCAAAASSPGAAGPGRAGLGGARTMRADCRPPRWRAGLRWEPRTVRRVSEAWPRPPPPAGPRCPAQAAVPSLLAATPPPGLGCFCCCSCCSRTLEPSKVSGDQQGSASRSSSLLKEPEDAAKDAATPHSMCQGEALPPGVSSLRRFTFPWGHSFLSKEGLEILPWRPLFYLLLDWWTE